MARCILDAIHDNVATKADVRASEAARRRRRSPPCVLDLSLGSSAVWTVEGLSVGW